MGSKGIKNTLAIISVKGGVGKTTLTTNLGIVLAKEHSIKTLAVDTNLSVPNLGLHLDIIDPSITLQDVLSDKAPITDAIYTHNSGLDVILSSMVAGKIKPSKIVQKLRGIKDKYEIILLDTPPGFGEEITAAVKASDEIIIITNPEFPTISSTFKAIKLARELRTPVKGVVLNMVRKGDGVKERIDYIESLFEAPVLAVIPDDKNVRRGIDIRKPVVLYKPHAKSSRKIRRLASKLFRVKYKKSLLDWLLDMLDRSP